ncbi:pentapeptide repeat-containing protein [Streptomyces sp. NPDC050315]|uniref:pentapeptide repeat-containing protein n=1 Tax=Streptomyces sp. NPDC050315 TaxID=3155039 RepID=UPI0034463F15
MTTSTPPDWPHCTHEGCQGIQVPGSSVCLAHLAPAQLAAHLGTLRPGGSIDLRGTEIDGTLLSRILDAVRDPGTSQVRLAEAHFDKATFLDEADFEQATFIGSGPASFAGATFQGLAYFVSASFSVAPDFSGVTFADRALFNDAIFHRTVLFKSATFADQSEFVGAQFKTGVTFGSATFAGPTDFESVVFSGGATFEATKFLDQTFFHGVTFEASAWFASATFGDITTFDASRFARDANFIEVKFQGVHYLGPFVCEGTLNLIRATFDGPVTIEVAAQALQCHRTRWESTAALRLRYAKIDLSDAVLMQPISVTTAAAPYGDWPPLDESGSTMGEAKVTVIDLRSVDCAMLSLSNIDLKTCRLAGAFHLDQLRLEGNCTFNKPPNSRTWVRGVPLSWMERQVIEEERQWRTLCGRPMSAGHAWGPPPQNDHDVPDLTTLATVYRQLRKGREDAKDEPGAADFYYGEMEMRRHSHGWRKAERWLLQAYWLLSGYGLRASRAIGWLAVAMMATILLMMGYGLPNDSPKQTASGTVPAGGGKVTFEIDKEDPRNPTGARFTTKRFEKALNVTLNSVVFRSSGQDLTTAGTYIEMTSRLTEPILLGFAGLAIRGRVKRGS